MPWDIQILDRTLLALVATALALAVVLLGWPAWASLAQWIRRSPSKPPAVATSTTAGGSTPWHHSLRSRLELLALAIGIFGGFLTIYLAYGTLRNQSMLTAKIAINADAGRLLDWERQSPKIRCLYNWYSSYDDGDLCLATIATNGDAFSEASLYIEEVFFIFKQARDDENAWKSEYIESIKYWRSGVEEDPTGLFANYLATVASYVDPPNSAAKMREEIERAGIKMPRACDGHYRVRACFRAIGQDVEKSDACHGIPMSEDTARSLPKLEATCREAAARRLKETAS